MVPDAVARGGYCTQSGRPVYGHKKCPGSDAGALNVDDAILLASHSVQPSLALFMLGKDDVDLRVGRDRDDNSAGRV